MFHYFVVCVVDFEIVESVNEWYIAQTEVVNNEVIDVEEFFGIVYKTDDCISISDFMISFLDNNSFCKKVMFCYKISISILFSFPCKVLILFSKSFELDSVLLVKIETSQFTYLIIELQVYIYASLDHCFRSF